jgi:hypothetical protein
MMLVIVTHSLVDVARQLLDPIFFRRETRRLRAGLERLVRIAGEQDELAENLGEALDSLCASVRATYGLLIVFEGDGLRVAADYRRPGEDLSMTQANLAADDILPLPPGRFGPPLDEAALLIPLYADARQVGALLLGRPINGTRFSQADLEFLLDPSDRLADAIRDAQREAEHLQQVARLLDSQRRPAAGSWPPNQNAVKGVETALRNLSNYAFLGEHPLAGWALVQQRLSADARTDLDRGKALYQVLSDAIAKLRPSGKPPSDPPPREWYPYVILHDAYLEHIPNRDIMSRLYISEGTFNRTRRAAIQALARTLEQMEAAAEV